MHERKPQLRRRSAARPAAMACGSRSMASTRPSRTQGLEDARRVPAAPERRVDIVAARVAAASPASASSTSTGVCSSPIAAVRSPAHIPPEAALPPRDPQRGPAADLQRQRIELGRQIGGHLLALAATASRRSFQRASSHNSKRLPCPISIAVALEPRELAQLRRQQHPAVPVELEIGRVAYHQPLQPARLRIAGSAGSSACVRSAPSRAGGR